MSAMFYVAAMSTEADGGIYRYEMREMAAPRQVGFNPLSRTTYLAWSPDRKFLYATCLVGKSGGVTAFSVNPDGSLVQLNSLSAEGMSTCHLVVSANAKYLYAANYSSSSFSEFELAADGSLKALKQLVRHEGKGPNAKRQECAHPHFTSFTPDGKYLIVIDLGIDAVVTYPFDPEKGIDVAGRKINRIEPAGSGPRHLVFDASGKLAYLLDELGNTVHSLRYDEGGFSIVNRVSTLPRLCNVEATKASAIRLSPDGRFLFASNRGYDSIAVYAIDGKGGMQLVDMVAAEGSSPRDINFLPGGKMFAATNEYTNNVVFFDYDAEKGKLTPNGLVYKHPNPLHLFW